MFGQPHGPWCNTVTFKTKCPGCRDSVFFFRCDCGSRVFFDELGSPWPIHDCDTSWTRKLQRTTDTTGKITVALSEGITVSRDPDSFGIDSSIIDRVHQAEKVHQPDPFVAVEPEDNAACSVVGVLREITRNACPFKKYLLEETAIGRAMLGSLGKQKMGRITVHVPLTTKAQAKSFTLWIPTTLIEDSRIICGLAVSLTVKSVGIPQHGYAWFSDEFEIIG